MSRPRLASACFNPGLLLFASRQFYRSNWLLLALFLIQATQNRDSEAIQVKLDELIRSIEGAHLALLDLEELEEEELNQIHASYEKLAQRARKDLRKGKADTGVREVTR